MDQHKTQPCTGSGRPDRDPFASGTVELASASVEARGCMGLFAQVVRHLQPPAIDRG
jgi:hypothetical protein